MQIKFQLQIHIELSLMLLFGHLKDPGNKAAELEWGLRIYVAGLDEETVEVSC